jgi:hypothetical protein
MLLMKAVTSPTLDGSGQFTQEFGEFDKIKSAQVVFTNPFISAYLLGCSWSISGNILTVTVEKVHLVTTWAWVVAITGDVASQVFTMLVDGE